MLLSIFLILTLGLSLSWVSKKLKLPGLVGMLLCGIIIGPYGLNLLDQSILTWSADIRKIALIIILTRAGLSLKLSDLKKVGRPALMMCFIPASLELIGSLILGQWLLDLSLLESAIMGSVLAAVSPAVVVPRMVRLMEENYGTKKGIPELILAGASVDDVYVIVLFTAFTGMATGKKVSLLSFINIPVSILLGIIVGYFAGYLLSLLINHIEMRASARVLLFLAISIGLVILEGRLTTEITFASLISVMFMGVSLQRFAPGHVTSISAKYNELWVGAEVFLFVLVGACVNTSYLLKVGPSAITAIILALIFRMLGVLICLLGSGLNKNERLFTMMAYTPKATVQAAIGGIPLAIGLACGDAVLTVAVLAIVITAPLGAFAIDISYKKLLSHDI